MVVTCDMANRAIVPQRAAHCSTTIRKRLLSSSPSSGNFSSSSDPPLSSSSDNSVDSDKWLQGEGWAKKIPSTLHQEDWEEADRKMRRTQGAAAKKANDARAANVMRALRGNIVIIFTWALLWLQQPILWCFVLLKEDRGKRKRFLDCVAGEQACGLQQLTKLTTSEFFYKLTDQTVYLLDMSTRHGCSKSFLLFCCDS